MKYVFDDFVVDIAARELLSGGHAVAVEPKVFDVLVHLIEHHDRVVSKDELIETVWSGRFISDTAVSSQVSALRRALGDDGRAQKYVKTMHGRGFRFVGSVVTSIAKPAAAKAPAPAGGIPEQDIRYCRSRDGTRIAYAIAGDGPPLVKTSHWLTHLEYDWESPIWSHLNRHLLETHRLVRFDARGHGLSEWDVEDLSLDRQVEDLETVVDEAGLDRFPILGVSQAAAISIAYAAKHPERVSRLLLFGGFDCGWRHTGGPRFIATTEALKTVLEGTWGNSPTGQGFCSLLLMPEAPPESQRWLSDLQQKTSTGKTAVALLEEIGRRDVRHLLDKVQAPTLVVHARRDPAIPYAAGQRLAAGIRGARFATLDSGNHIIPETDPAWPRCAQLFRDFLAEDAG
ncbi:alpha/beta fold hydrolase [Oricola sp.]|uniref:alpha/beta fold hydrolase n=1 Tax=Oricola sp. TaxID=1979950 RepID=UPI003BAAF1E2